MHSTFFLNHKSSRPKHEETDEQDEDITVELSTKRDQRNVIVSGNTTISKEFNDSEEDELLKSFSTSTDNYREIDFHNLEEPSSSYDIDNTLMNENDIDISTIQSLREAHQQKLDQVEREYLNLREQNSMSIDVQPQTRNIRIKNPMSSYRSVTFSDQYDGELITSPTSDKNGGEGSQQAVSKKVSDLISEVSLDDDNTSVSSDDTEFKQDYGHFINDPSLHNRLIDEESVEREYNYNDISDNCTVVSDISEFQRERERETSYYNDIERKNITVPLPFKFEEREATKPLGIHRRKMDDYINKIKTEEEQHLNKRFKANPVPKSSKIPLYESVRIRTEMQSKLERKALETMTRRMIKPFYFAERDERRAKQLEEERLQKQEDNYKRFEKGFVANPVPSHTFRHIYTIKQERDVKKRSARVQERSQLLLQQSSLPPRMEMWKKVGKSQTPTNPLENELTLRPKINHNVPDFDNLQRKFQETLYLAKRTQKLTVPQPFKFNNSLTEKDMKRIADEVGLDDDVVLHTSTRSANNWETQQDRKTTTNLPKRPSSATPSRPTTAQSKDTFATRMRNDQIKKQIAEREERKKQLEDLRGKHFNQQRKIHNKVAPNIQQVSENKENLYGGTLSSTQRRREKESLIDSRPYMFETALRREAKERVYEDLKKTLSEHGTSYLLSSLKL